MVLRKQTDGAWRIAREFLAADSPSPQPEEDTPATLRGP
jgi:ketosteroid isomerase-like protein